MMVSNRLVWGVLAVAAGAGLAAVLLPPARGRWRRSGASDEQSAAWTKPLKTRSPRATRRRSRAVDGRPGPVS
jgi:hypothetical protein